MPINIEARFPLEIEVNLDLFMASLNYTKANYFKDVSFTVLKISIVKLTAEMLSDHF